MNGIIFAVLFPFAAAVLCWFLFRNRKGKNDIAAVTMLLVSAVETAAVTVPLLKNITGTQFDIVTIAGVGGLGLHFMYSGFRGVFGVLTALAWFVTFLFSKEYMADDEKVVRYDFFNLMTLGATMGIFYAADFFTLFFFFEMMSFTSFMWVAHRQTKESAYAAGTYLGIAIAGGMAILMGLFIVYSRIGTLYFGEMCWETVALISLGENPAWMYVAAVCMFAGFGAKAGAFPVHVWLPDSYTQAPVPATALLSAILSKTGVFGLMLVSLELQPLQGSWGVFLLVIGVITMVVGGIRGVMSSNFKTTLAFSSMSQIGFVLTGVGMQVLLAEMAVGFYGDAGHFEEAVGVFGMAVNGTFIHMVNHSLVKLVLFMTAGVVFAQVGSYELNKVRGFGRGKPFLLVTFLLAAAGVGGIPVLNGYISKTLLHESIVEYTSLLGDGAVLSGFMKAVEGLFLFSGGLTVAYMTKLFVTLFVERNADSGLQAKYEGQKQYASLSTKAAIALCALPIPFIGLLPGLTAERVAAYGFVRSEVEQWYYVPVDVHYFSLTSLSGAMISIAVGVAVYVLVVRLWMLRRKSDGYQEVFPAWMNMEKYLYRAVFYTAVPFVLGIISRILDSIVDTLVVLLRRTVYCDRALPYELPEGNRVTHRIGCSMERIRMVYCMIARKEYESKHYEHKLAIKSTDIFENFRIIERSLSFGLFMFCVGLGLTMIYLLVVN